MPEGGAHSIDKIPIFRLGEKKTKQTNKNFQLFPAAAHEALQLFKASIRIAPFCLLCCSLKVQHQNATVKQIIMFVNMFHSSRSLNAFLHQGAFSSLFHQLIK